MTGAPPRTLFDKIWDAHVVERFDDGTCVRYIDRHLLDELHSPQAFEGLRQAGRPEATLAVADHNIPTENRRGGIPEEGSRLQVATLAANVVAFGMPYIPVLDVRQDIVHVVGPELGFPLPGQIIVSGGSHASTHGALGALPFGTTVKDLAMTIVGRLGASGANGHMIEFRGGPSGRATWPGG